MTVSCVGADVDDLALEHADQLDDLAPRLGPAARTVTSSSSRSTDVGGVQLGDLDHVDQLEQLLGDLLDRRLLDVDHDGDAAEPLVVGRGHGQGEDVEAAPGEQAGDPGQHPGLVLDQHREGVVRGAGRPSLDHPFAAGLLGRVHDDVVVGRAGRHHREHLLPGVGAEVDDDRAVVDRVGLVDGRLHLLGRLDPERRRSPWPRPT